MSTLGKGRNAKKKSNRLRVGGSKAKKRGKVENQTVHRGAKAGRPRGPIKKGGFRREKKRPRCRKPGGNGMRGGLGVGN